MDKNRLWELTQGDKGVPTAEQVNKWSRDRIGHDALNQWICVKTRAKRLGFWGLCEVCGGSSEMWRDDAHKTENNAWKPTEPPVGEGYQMWETTSEGSPISPVFASPEELARWLADNKASWFGDATATYDQWMSLIGDAPVEEVDDG